MQYPPDTTHLYAYFESRGGEYPELSFFGLQYIIKKYLEGQVVTAEKIDEMEQITEAHLGDAKLFNRKGWEYILDSHGGRLPISIKAVPEGEVVSATGSRRTSRHSLCKAGIPRLRDRSLPG